MRLVIRSSVFSRCLLVMAVGSVLTGGQLPGEERMITDDTGERFLARYYDSGEERPRVLDGTFPCYPATQYRGKFYWIRGVEVNTPYFIAEGMKHYVRSEDAIILMPDLQFLHNTSASLSINNRVKIASGDLPALGRPSTQWIHVPYLESGVKRSLSVDFEITVDRTLEDAFAVVVFHDDDFNAQMYWRHLGKVEADVPLRAGLVTDPIPRSEHFPHNFILLFDRKGEIPTARRMEIGSSLAALCFRWVHDHNAHYRRANLDTDLPVFPMFRGSAMIKVDDEIVTGRTRIHGRVDRYGFLQNTEVVSSTSEYLEFHSLRMVNRWLFFPELAGGEFQETRVAIPLIYSKKGGAQIGK